MSGSWWVNILVTLVLTAAAMWLFAPVSGALLVAWLLAYLLAPSVAWLEKRGLGRSPACLLTYTLALLGLVVLLLLLLPALIEQISRFLQNLPAVLEHWQNQWWPKVAAFFGWKAEFDGTSILETVREYLQRMDISQLSPWAAWGASAVASVFGAILVLVNALLVPLVAFYLLRDWHIISGRIRARVPKKISKTCIKLTREADEMISRFLRGQLSIMLILAVLYGIGLSVIGIPNALAIGLLAGALSFVPYLGLIMGLAAALLMSMWAFGFDAHLWMVLALFAAVQVFESFYLTPKVLGDKLGLHPVVILLALVIAGDRFGFAGLLMAVPITAAGMVLIREADHRYRSSCFFTPED